MIECQLPTEISQVQVDDLLINDDWWMSQKLDGQRLIVDIGSEGQFECYGRAGISIHPTPEILRDIKVDPRFSGWTMDGELLDQGFYAFDLLRGEGSYVNNMMLDTRLAFLDRLIKLLECEVIKGTPVWKTTEEKQFNWQRASEEHLEGVVFKKAKAPYKPGRNMNFVKYKFVKDVDCQVIDKEVNGKRNFLLGIYNGDHIVEVGKVSALTGDGPRVRVGDVVTVECLYASENGNLVQPVTPRLRRDKKPEECTIDQIFQLQTRKDLIL